MARSRDPVTMADGPAGEPPDWLFPEEHPLDPEDPDAWPGDFAATAEQAEAEGVDDAEWREALLDAGIGTGWAHHPGAGPVPGVHE